MIFMATQSEFWSRIARDYAASPVRNTANYEDTLARTFRHLGSDQRLLELGCGTGPTALRLAPQVAQVCATDIAPGMIEIARERLAADGAGNVRFDTADVKQACSQGPFDAVAAFNLLHLLPDVDAALADIHGALKPGGVFISKSACLGGRGRLLWPVIRVMQALGKAPGVQWFGGRALIRRIETAGFRITETKRYGGLAPTLFVVAHRTG